MPIAGVARQITLCFAIGVASASAQPLVSSAIDRPERVELNRTIQRLFPTQRPESPGRFAVTLCFLPSFHPEVCVKLRYGLDSSGAVEYTSFKKPLRNTLELHESRKFRRSPAQIAEETGFERTLFAISATQVSNWLKAILGVLTTTENILSDRALILDGTNEVSVQLDGTEYQLSIQIGESQFSLMVVGSEIDPPTTSETDDVPVVKVMNAIRLQVRGMLKGK